MNISLDDYTITTGDGYTFIPADDSSTPLHDLLYAHHISVAPTRPKPVRQRQSRHRKTVKEPRRQSETSSSATD